MKLMNVIAFFTACMMTQVAMANEPETPGYRTQCSLNEATMVQQAVTTNGKVFIKKAITLAGLHAPELGISEENLVLEYGGVSLDGASYEAVTQGFFFLVRIFDEPASGPMALNRIRITRRNARESQIRFYDCQISDRN